MKLCAIWSAHQGEGSCTSSAGSQRLHVQMAAAPRIVACKTPYYRSHHQLPQHAAAAKGDISVPCVESDLQSKENAWSERQEGQDHTAG